MNFVRGRSFGSQTSGVKFEDGKWHLTVTMSETVLYPNGTSREETITHTAENTDFDTAHKEAMRQVLQELQDLVYSRGFDSLIEGMDYERSMEALGDSDITPDEVAKSE